MISEEAGDGEVGQSDLYHYPRLCLIHWHDHHQAAFYPPLDNPPDGHQPFRFIKKKIIQFVHDALERPDVYWRETEHF